MPQAANIVINDGKATPVAHTFVPSKINELISTFFNSVASLLIGRESLTITRREPTEKIAGKVNLKLVLPVEQTVDGVIKVVRQTLVSIDIVTAPDGLESERKDALKLAQNLLGDASVVSIVTKGEGIY